MFENFDDILNVDDIAKALKIGTSQAYKLVRSGKIQAFKEGRAWKYNESVEFHTLAFIVIVFQFVY